MAQKIKKLASYSHRTATTARPCYIPVLGDSAGAGRIRLARAAKVRRFFTFSLLKTNKKSVHVWHARIEKLLKPEL